jgi:hypothetical protein
MKMKMKMMRKRRRRRRSSWVLVQRGVRANTRSRREHQSSSSSSLQRFPSIRKPARHTPCSAHSSSQAKSNNRSRGRGWQHQARGSRPGLQLQELP